MNEAKKSIPQPLERSFEVKLYHPIEENIACALGGKSFRFTVKAKDTGVLRTKIETGDNGFFKGDRCVKCGTLAKVTII